jgi:hypothetical protein
MKAIFVLAASALAVAGCANPPPTAPARDDPKLQAMMECSAGVLAGYKTAAEVGSDLKTKISLGVNVEDAVKGYIFEVLPAQDRLKGYQEYLGCMKGRRP